MKPIEPNMASTALDPGRLKALIAEELSDLVNIRHDLHAHPELMYEEHRTSGVVQRELERAGIEFKAGLAKGTGVLGHLPGTARKAAGSRAVGLRADMDALAITEMNECGHASKNHGVMHACGHDGHTTVLLGAARVLAKLARQTSLPRPVLFLFQPAEEGGAGGKRMIEDGCLDGRLFDAPIDFMFGLHGWPQLPVGLVLTKPGPMTAATDTFRITVTGRAGHAAWPDTCADPIVAGAAIIGALQTIVSRNVSPMDSAVLSITQFHGGKGDSANIIPPDAVLMGTLRTLNQEVTEMARRRLYEVVKSTAEAHGCAAQIDFVEASYPVLMNSPEAVKIFEKVATEMLGAECLIPMPTPVMGGEDFAFYTEKARCCFFALGLLPRDQKEMPMLHTPSFDFNDDAIAIGVELFCRLALEPNFG